MQLSGVRLSVCPSMGRVSSRVCLYVVQPAGDIDRLLHGAQQRDGRMRAVPRCQRTYTHTHTPI